MFCKIKKGLSLLLLVLLIMASVTPLNLVEVEAASKVTRISGSSIFKTSFAVADALKKELKVTQFDAIILTKGSFYADALSGSSLAGLVKAPILLVSDSLVSDVATYVNKNLKKGGTVYILGGSKAVSRSYESCFDPKKEYVIKRLGGTTHYDTNLKILKEVDKISIEKTGKVNSKFLICTGRTYADSLSAGSTGYPIMLVNGELTAAQKAFLEGRGKSSITILGGGKAVPYTLDKVVKKYGSSVRCYGKTQYDTAIAIAKKFFGSKPKQVILVTGSNFQEGLVAGPLAQAKKCPILLASSLNIAPSYNYQINAGKPPVTIVGSADSMPTKAAACSGVFKKGWNAYAGNYVYLNSNGKIRTDSFTEENYKVSPNNGGIIYSSAKSDISRRRDSARYGTAIVVHIRDQKLDLVKGGVVKLSTDVVTGKDLSPTPTGTYSVRNKVRNITLTGYGVTGKYYEVPVKYWMAFIGNSYGIHDAMRRSRFGGNIYREDGSLGCVNIPSSVMPRLFDLAYVGMPVIIKK